jgi:hypothetical protein
MIFSGTGLLLLSPDCSVGCVGCVGSNEGIDLSTSIEELSRTLGDDGDDGDSILEGAGCSPSI